MTILIEMLLTALALTSGSPRINSGSDDPIIVKGSNHNETLVVDEDELSAEE